MTTRPTRGWRLPLRYRITAAVVLVELVILVGVVRVVLDRWDEVATTQIAVREQATLDLLEIRVRDALLTGEFAELQPFLEGVVRAPGVLVARATDHHGHIVASSRIAEIGRVADLSAEDVGGSWRRRELRGETRILGGVETAFSTAPRDDARRESRNTGLAVAMLGLLVTAGSAMALSRLLTRRLERLETTAQRLAAGDWQARAWIPGSDEIAALGRAFDTMAEQIEEQLVALQEGEHRYHELVDQIRDVLFCIDNQGRLSVVNRAFESRLGWSAEEARGREFADLVHPRDRQMAEAALGQVGHLGKPVPIDLRLEARSGESVPVEGELAPLTGLDRESVAIAVLRDVSERRRIEAELRSQELQLRQAQKMDALGRLAGGVAHDFNNLLTVILGEAEALLDRPDDPQHRGEALTQIRDAARRAADLTGQLLAFSRKRPLRVQPLDLNALVGEATPLLRRLAGDDVRIATRLEPGIGPVLLDRAQAEQILMNLVVNARDALPDGGELRIETSLHRGEGGEPDEAELRVEDDGKGMEEGIRSRVFDPFFTTKAHGEGTGLGLSTVYGIVRQSDGRIEIESEPECGTVVRIRFPVIEKPAARVAASEPPMLRPVGEGELVLLVEDEDTVRRFALRALQRAGFRVIPASCGEEALALVDGTAEPIALIVTDVIMPGMSGPELVEALAEQRPGTPVLFCSGYPAEISGAGRILVSGSDLLEKPYTPTQLLERARQAIDGSGA